jgi:hypothetical protein
LYNDFYLERENWFETKEKLENQVGDINAVKQTLLNVGNQLDEIRRKKDEAVARRTGLYDVIYIDAH